MLGLKETIDQLATANGVRWYGHVLRRDDNSVLRVDLDFDVSGKRKRGRLKKAWKEQVEEEIGKIGWKKEDALNRDKWRESASNCRRNGMNLAISAKGTTPDERLITITTIYAYCLACAIKYQQTKMPWLHF